MNLSQHVRTSKEIDAIRESGAMLGKVLALLRNNVGDGVSTAELDQIAKKEIKALGGKPAFYGYQGFPAAVCTSVNSEVVHGIPRTDMVLKNGDIASFDCGVNFHGMITDAAISLIVGGDNQANSKVRELLDATSQSLEAGINQVKAGVRVGTISSAIQEVLDRHKLGIVRDLVGHGVGRKLHEEPEIPNFGTPGEGPTLLAGMTIAIEPMATLGGHQVVVENDGWTITTRDNSLSAHFEHTVLVTENGAEILTLS